MAFFEVDKNIVVDDDREFEVLALNGDFIAYFKPGRTIYVSSGSEYQPAKIAFARIHEITSYGSDGLYDLEIIMEVSPRR